MIRDCPMNKKILLCMLLLLSACANKEIHQYYMIDAPKDVSFYVNGIKIAQGSTLFGEAQSKAIEFKLETGSYLIGAKDNCQSFECAFIANYPRLYKMPEPYFPVKIKKIINVGPLDVLKINKEFKGE